MPMFQTPKMNLRNYVGNVAVMVGTWMVPPSIPNSANAMPAKATARLAQTKNQKFPSETVESLCSKSRPSPTMAVSHPKNPAKCVGPTFASACTSPKL